MKLFDAYGREIDTGRLLEAQAAPTMAGVRNIYSGQHPSIGLSPERMLAILTQAEYGDPYLYLELAEDMEEKDLHYLAVLGTRKSTCAQLDLVIKPASNSAADQKAADLVRTALKGPAINLEASLFNCLDAIGKGFSATEIMWDRQGREWTPRALTWRDPRWFMFNWIDGCEILVRTLANEQSISDPRGDGINPVQTGAAHMKSWAATMSGIQPLTAPLTPYKFITHIARAKSGLPVRGGIARSAAWSWLFKNFLLKDWLGYAETFGQPLRLGKYAPGATEADKELLLEAVTNVGTDAAAILPESMMIQFEAARGATGSHGGELYREFCEYLDAQVSKAVLGQTLTTELPRGGGSRAAAQVHQMVRRDILAADARSLSATLFRDLVKAIVDLNLGPPANDAYPACSLGLPDDIDDKVFADIVCALADRGLQLAQSVVLDKLGLPAPAAGESVLHPAQKGASA